MLNRNDINRMIQTAGIEPQYTRPQDAAVRKGHALCGQFKGYKADVFAIDRLVDLVAAAEREACAQVCENERSQWDLSRDGWQSAHSCAAAIRARGEKGNDHD